MGVERIEYCDVDESQVHLIAELRAQFVRLNRALAPEFAREYTDETMAKNLRGFLDKAARGEMRIFLARDAEANRYVGFCMTTLVEGEGFIESFLVEEGLRGSGIGTRLFQNALDWLESRSARSIGLNVLPANEAAIRFYRRFGFSPLKLTMKRKKQS